MTRTLRWAVPMAPALALLGLFFAGPVLWSCYAAFTNMALSGAAAADPAFTGLDNLRQLLADPAFRRSVVLTVVFVLASAVVGQNGLGLLLALLMRGRSRRFGAVLGAVVVGAWVIPEIVAGFVWYAFFSDEGTLNTLLGRLGLPARPWLIELPMLAVIIANVWRGTAFSMLVYAAALSEVPPELTEAAAVDGAGPLRRLRAVTLPLIKRAVMTNLMLITLQTLALFTLIFVMTGGGPGNATQTLPLFMYQEAFRFFQLGYGTAIALVLLLLGAAASLGYMRLLKVEV